MFERKGTARVLTGVVLLAAVAAALSWGALPGARPGRVALAVFGGVVALGVAAYVARRA